MDSVEEAFQTSNCIFKACTVTCADALKTEQLKETNGKRKREDYPEPEFSEATNKHNSSDDETLISDGFKPAESPNFQKTESLKQEKPKEAQEREKYEEKMRNLPDVHKNTSLLPSKTIGIFFPSACAKKLTTLDKHFLQQLSKTKSMRHT